jgi:hypothetical protein
VVGAAIQLSILLLNVVQFAADKAPTVDPLDSAKESA